MVSFDEQPSEVDQHIKCKELSQPISYKKDKVSRTFNIIDFPLMAIPISTSPPWDTTVKCGRIFGKRPRSRPKNQRDRSNEQRHCITALIGIWKLILIAKHQYTLKMLFKLFKKNI